MRAYFFVLFLLCAPLGSAFRALGGGNVDAAMFMDVKDKAAGAARLLNKYQEKGLTSNNIAAGGAKVYPTPMYSICSDSLISHPFRAVRTFPLLSVFTLLFFFLSDVVCSLLWRD